MPSSQVLAWINCAIPILSQEKKKRTRIFKATFLCAGVIQSFDEKKRVSHAEIQPTRHVPLTTTQFSSALWRGEHASRLLRGVNGCGRRQ